MTLSQTRAVAARGNVLVAAGAGTGKTHTVVERCLDVLRQGTSLDRILMVTFTDAAAAEMRHRIRQALLKRLTESQTEADRDHWHRQAALLDVARISTLHSFCLGLIREHFHRLNLDPQARVLEEAQARLLAETVLDELVEAIHSGTLPRIPGAMELLRLQGRNPESRLRGLILRLHRRAQALEDPAGWLHRQMAHYAAEQAQCWRDWLWEGFGEWRGYWEPVLAEVSSRAPNVGACLEALRRVAAPHSLESLGAAFQTVFEQDATEAWPKGQKLRLRAPLKKFFEEAAFLASLVERREGVDGLQQDWDWVRGPMRTLLQLTLEFGDRFEQAKRQLGGLDFADLEQLALRLLLNPDRTTPSPLALVWRQRLDFVFVDECQDINRAQDAILRLVSRDGAPGPNRFLVGDVKQSIYRFRLADPAIFREYESAWRTASEAGQRIPLSENFRSREGILDFVNALFATLMRRSVGGVDYEEDAQLRFGAPEERAALRRADKIVPLPDAENAGSPCVEFHLIAKPSASDGNSGDGEANDAGQEAGSENETDDLLASEREARLVAARLHALHESGFSVWDSEGGQFRPAQWSDMVVLMRSPRGRAEVFAKEFLRAGVPLLASRGGFYTSLEVSDLMSLLRLLDNPRQDVPLLAVLRSPLVGLSLDELVEIRRAHRSGPYWQALTVWRESQGQESSSSSLAARVREFDHALRRWRRLAREGPLSLCLEQVLAETHFEAILLAGDRGDERVANVRRLLDLARRFDPWQREGLFRFLRFVANQEEAEVDEEPAPPPVRDAVRLMSIHRSKGLEFPIVALAGLGGKFNQEDLKEDILISERFGLASKVLPPDRTSRYPSLAYWMARRHEWRERLGEEMRLLYVAATRARDRLILVGTAASQKQSNWWGDDPAAPLRDLDVLSAQNPLEWLRLWLPGHTQRGDWIGELEGCNALLRWRIHHPDSLLFTRPRRTGTKEAATPLQGTPEQREDLMRRLGWSYPFAQAASKPAKATVTALRRQANRGDEEETMRPRFAASETILVRRRDNATGLSAAERGLAHHHFLEKVDLKNTCTEASLSDEARRLQREGWLSPAEMAALDYPALWRFWGSPLGERIRQAPEKRVHRELPFTARFGREEFAAAGLTGQTGLGIVPEGEFLVVQGTVDLAVIEPERIWLVDFKTDHFPHETLDNKIALYAPQVRLYGVALERIYRRPVTERWLCFLAPGEAREV